MLERAAAEPTLRLSVPILHLCPDRQQRSDQIANIGAHLVGDLEQLNHINAPFAALDFRHEGLGSPQPQSQLHLSEPGRFPCLGQELGKPGISRRRAGPRHATCVVVRSVS